MFGQLDGQFGDHQMLPGRHPSPHGELFGRSGVHFPRRPDLPRQQFDGGQWQQFVLREGQPALKIAAYEDRIIAGAIAKDGTVYGLSRRDAPMGKILQQRALAQVNKITFGGKPLVKFPISYK